VGRGWGFGFHEAMDQIGAVTGPLIVAAILYFQGGYRQGFAFLLLPAVLALVVIATAARLYPHPQHLEVNAPALNPNGFTRPYWLYVVAAGLLGAGYADFPLIAYHFGKTTLASPGWIPLFYAIAMAVDGVAALILGRLFDRLGLPVIVATAILSALFAPLVFLGGFKLALLGIILWGIGMGSLESIIKAALADMIPRHRRATGFGLFNAGFGLFWFLGSVLMGFLYDFSLGALVAFSVTAQLLAIPFFLAVSKKVCLQPR
jgi:MFS family permease